MFQTWLSSSESAFSSSVGLIAERSWVQGSVVIVATGSLINKKSSPWQDTMAMCLSNALRLWWQHALCAPLGVEICAGWKQVWVRDNNIVNNIVKCLLASNWIGRYINITYYFYCLLETVELKFLVCVCVSVLTYILLFKCSTISLGIRIFPVYLPTCCGV